MRSIPSSLVSAVLEPATAGAPSPVQLQPKGEAQGDNRRRSESQPLKNNNNNSDTKKTQKVGFDMTVTCTLLPRGNKQQPRLRNYRVPIINHPPPTTGGSALMTVLKPEPQTRSWGPWKI